MQGRNDIRASTRVNNANPRGDKPRGVVRSRKECHAGGGCPNGIFRDPTRVSHTPHSHSISAYRHGAANSRLVLCSTWHDDLRALNRIVGMAKISDIRELVPRPL